MAKRIRGLTEQQIHDIRDEALKRAKSRIGDEPRLEEFRKRAGSSIQTYSTSLQILTLGLLLIVLIVAGVESAINITRSTGTWRFFVMAEPAIIVSILSLSTLFANFKWGRILLGVTILGSIALAITGNIESKTEFTTFLDFLEVALPPIYTLAGGFILERYFLRSIADRVKTQRAYENARRDYFVRLDAIEQTPEFRNTFGTLIWQALTTTNSRGRYANENRGYLEGLSLVERKRLVRREISKMNWFTATPDDTHDDDDGMTVNQQQLIQSSASGDAPSRQNGHSSGESLEGIEPSQGILGVTVTEQPDPAASPTDRMARLAQDAQQHPQLFDTHTRDELANFYQISTGSVSNVKRNIQQNGSSNAS